MSVCVCGGGVLALLSEGQGKQGWILAMGLENKILSGAAHLQLSLRGCRGGHSQWEQKPSPEPPVCQGGPPGYLGSCSCSAKAPQKEVVGKEARFCQNLAQGLVGSVCVSSHEKSFQSTNHVNPSHI